MSRKYLYGAAVQGIQGFIFSTNKLSEIIGASELVERVCTTYFNEVLKEKKGERIQNAAGQVKYLFDNYEDCQEIVRIFPKYIMEHVPGTTISQAVVSYEEGMDDYKKKSQELEILLREQRNRLSRPAGIGLMGIERSRQTGLPATKLVKGEHLDDATQKKRGVVNDTNQKLCKDAFGLTIHANDINYYTDKIATPNSWIAIIHADGNGLGQVVQNIGSNKEKFKEFSEALTEITKSASQQAISKVCGIIDSNIPIRPVVLSGDDFTVICRGDIAVKLATEFIAAFEEKSEEKGYALTACAGVAFVKSSFPFYYGYELAEKLCEKAKENAKEGLERQELAPSCLQFFKVEESYVEDYNNIVRRVLSAPDYNLNYGPYYLHNEDAEAKNRWTLATLLKTVSMFKDDKESNAVKSHIRQWLSLIFTNDKMADQHLRRLESVSGAKIGLIKALTRGIDEIRVEGNETKTVKRIPAYDVLSLSSVIH